MSIRKSKKLSELDPESKEYWEKVLHDHHLGLGRAKSDKLSFVGNSQDLERIEVARSEEATYGGRKVRPRGAKPE